MEEYQSGNPGLFHVLPSLEHTKKSTVLEHHNDEDVDHLLRNVLHLNDYVQRHQNEPTSEAHDSEGSTTVAALKMIEFDNFHNSPSGGPPAAIDELDFGQFAADGHETFSERPLSGSGSPKAPVKVVPYNPAEKTKRLGRPRKHLNRDLAPPEDSASENLDKAVMSKFRLDLIPVEGPGSRGGKAGARRDPKGRVTSNSVRKRKQQATLNFPSAESKDDGKHSDPSVDPVLQQKTSKKISKSKKSDSGTSVSETENSSLAEKKRKTVPDAFSNLNLVPDSRKSASVPKKESDSILQAKIRLSGPRPSKLQTSRTTVVNNHNKITRQLPGPLVGLYYDAYDGVVIDSKANKNAASEKIALGFPVSRVPWAEDIIYLISYLTKFHSVVEVEDVGPQDIEKGLGLQLPVSPSDEKHVSKTPSEAPEVYDISYISPLMETLFCRLLTLVLNRKKEVLPNGQVKAIAELKTLALFLGLPKEWRDDSNILKKRHVELETDSLPVDRSKPEILVTELAEYQPPGVLENPFDEPDFEAAGLSGISRPLDRLIMLRTLAQWSLSTSNALKALITQSIQGQDISGDKETMYAARAVLKGFKNTEDLKKETEQRIAKRTAVRASNGALAADLDMILKYIDPTSDPLAHSMRLRLDEFVVGDIGFNVGRFFFTRMVDSSTGGFDSVDKMRSKWNRASSVILGVPSHFKLYVQDVRQMLADSFTEYGVEFNENGEEIEVKEASVPPKYWYEVASNVQEMTDLVGFLSSRLGIDKSNPENVISKSSVIYKPSLHLYQYLSGILPLLARQEDAKTTFVKPRASRESDVNYNETTDFRETKQDDYSDGELAMVLDEGEDDDYEDDDFDNEDDYEN